MKGLPWTLAFIPFLGGCPQSVDCGEAPKVKGAYRIAQDAGTLFDGGTVTVDGDGMTIRFVGESGNPVELVYEFDPL